MASYDKPHLTFDEQIARLRDRGMPNRDQAAAVAALRRIGYYRLSAYTHPFRRRDEAGLVQDDFIDGSTFEAAVALHDFDIKLRASLFIGLELFEIALRVQIAYTLGRRDKYGHLDPVSALDGIACERTSSAQPDKSEYEVWHQKYEKRCSDSQNEDFVRHFREKYDGRLPIWAATEVMELGGVVRLYGFLLREDKLKISRNFGPRRERDFRAWSRSLNLLRNHCAHGDRIWNRAIAYALPEFETSQVNAGLGHLSDYDTSSRRKLYPQAAILASLVTTIDPYTDWPRSFATQAKKLPGVPGVITYEKMGFPPDWSQLDLWTYKPRVREK